MDSFVLQTSDSDIQNGEFLGRLGFAANEADTGDARAISAVVSAMAEAPFTSTSNPTSIVFATAFDGDATNKLRITSSGNFLPFVSGIYDIGSGTLPFRKVFTDELRVGDYNFPTSDGSTGQVLSTDGAGQLSFIPVTSASDTFIDSLDFDTSTNVLTIGRNDGVDFTETINAGGGTIDGGGLADYNAKWVDSDTLTSGIIHESGNTLGINTPASGTSIVGYFKNTNTNGSWIINEGTDSGYPVVFEARENGKRLGVMYSYGSTYAGGSFASIGASGVAFSNITGDVAVGPLISTKDLIFGGGSAQYAKFTHTEFRINHDGLDRDFRVEGTSTQDLILADALENTVGVGTNSTIGKFNVFNQSTAGGGKGYNAIFGGYNNGTAVLINASVPQDTVYVNGFYSYCYPSNNSTISQMFHFRATPPEGAGTINIQHGFYAGPALQYANYNRGFTSLVPSGDSNQNYNIYAGGTAKNYVSGVLGIGTDSPTNQLDIYATGVHSGATIRGTNAPGLKIWDMSYTNGGSKIVEQASSLHSGVLILDADTNNVGHGSYMSLRVDGTERVQITEHGNVGIGVDPNLFLSSMPSHHPSLVLGDGNGHTSQTFYSSSNSSAVIYFADGTTAPSTYSGYIQYSHDLNRMQFATNSLVRMRIHDDGDVDIGDSSYPGSLTVTHTDGGCGLSVVDTGGSGVRIGDCAYASSPAYAGMTHTNYTNSQEYMIISSGYSTLVSSAANANTYIRGGENNNTYQLVVGTGYLAVGSVNERMKINSQKVEFNVNNENYDFVVNANNSVNPLIYADADSGTYGRLGIGRTPGTHVVDVSGSMRINPLPAATVTATLNRNPGYPTIRSDGSNPPNNWLIIDSAGGDDTHPGNLDKSTGRLALNYFNSDDVVICHGGGGVGIGQSAAPGAYALRVEGATSAFNAFQNTEANFRVFGSIDDSLIYADAGLNRVGINTNYSDLDYKFHVSYEPNVDDGIAILRDGSPNDGILIGEQAFRVNDDYQGITHPLYTGSYDYMLISAGSHTFMSAKSGANTYIRAGGNSSTFQAVITGSQFSIGNTSAASASNHFLINTTGAYVRNILDVGGHTTLNGGLTLNGDADVFGNIQTIGHGVGHIDDGIFLAYPGGGTDHNSTTLQTGYLKITLPVTWNYSMVNFALDVYEYNREELKTFKIGGYIYGGSVNDSPPYSLARWHNVSAQLDAGTLENTKFNVQFLHDGTKCAIYISKFDSNGVDLGYQTEWSYCQASVRDVFIGYGGLSLTDWEDGWDVGFTTTLGNYNILVASSAQQTTCARAYHHHESSYVFNELGEDVNFRVEGLDSPYLLNTDAGTNSVAIGSPVAGSTRFYVEQDDIEFTANATARTSWTYQISQTTADCIGYALGSQTYAFKYVDNGVSDTGYVLAGDFTGVAKGSGYLEQAYGVRAYGGIHTGSTGTVNHAFGVRSRVLNLGTGTATINNGYGLYIDSVAGTNHYGVYQIGPTDDNYFAGAVGVGTTYTSNAKLTVVDGAQTRLAIDTGTNLGSSEFGIDFIDRHNATSQGIEGQIASFVRSQRQGTGGSFDLIFGTVDGSDLAADADEKVRITSDGIVGVGSTTQGVDPTTVGADVGIHIAADNFPEIHFTNDLSGHGSPSGVQQTLNTSRFITTNRIPDSSIEFYTFDTSYVTKQRLRLGHTFAAFNATKEDIDFYVWGNDATNPLIYAQSNVDRVGINEVAPAYTLDVNGDVRLRGTFHNDTNASTVSIFDSTTNSNQTKRNTGNDTAWEGIDNQKWRIATPDNSTSAYKALFDVSLADYRVTAYHGANINLGRYSAADGGDFAVRGEGGTGAGTDGDNLIRTDATNHRVGIFNSSPQYRLDVKGSFSADSVNVNDAFTLPTADGALNQVMVTDGNGNLTWATQSVPGGTGNSVVRGTVSASNNQTSFSVGGGYTPGAIDVYLNGVKLINVVDFTATNGSSIELISAAQSGDTLEYVAFDRSTTAGTLQDTGDTMTGNLTVNADLIVTGYKETHTDNGNTGTAQTIDISDSTIQTYTLTGNCTFTMPTVEAGRSFTMLLKTGAGSFTATFTNVKFPKNTPPTVTTDANRMDLIVFTCDGTSWYGNATQEYHV